MRWFQNKEKYINWEPAKAGELSNERYIESFQIPHAWIDSKVCLAELSKEQTLSEHYRIRANHLIAKGNIDKAIKLLKMAISLYPTDLLSMINLGWCFGKSNCIDSGIEVLLKGQKICDDHPELLYKLGWLFSLKGDFNKGNIKKSNEYFLKAVNFYEKALNSDNKHIPSMIDGGLYYGKIGNYEKSLHLLSNAIDLLDKESIESRCLTGTEFQITDTDQKMYISKQILKLKGEAFYKRGWIYQVKEDYYNSKSDYMQYDNIKKVFDSLGFNGNIVDIING